MSLQRSFLFLVIVAASACSPTQQKPAETPAPPAAPPQAPLVAPPAEKAESPHTADVIISEEIKGACGIPDADAKFAFDSAKVRTGDQPVLNKLVQCFTTGKLSGRTMSLVGHADPRGEAEYNLVLGGKRANNVKSYLVNQGLRDAQAATTSRGEMDAKGADELSWSEDRRVDVMLVN